MLLEGRRAGRPGDPAAHDRSARSTSTPTSTKGTRARWSSCFPTFPGPPATPMDIYTPTELYDGTVQTRSCSRPRLTMHVDMNRGAGRQLRFRRSGSSGSLRKEPSHEPDDRRPASPPPRLDGPGLRTGLASPVRKCIAGTCSPGRWRRGDPGGLGEALMAALRKPPAVSRRARGSISMRLYGTEGRQPPKMPAEVVRLPSDSNRQVRLGGGMPSWISWPHIFPL